MKFLPKVSMALAASALVVAAVPAQAGTRASSSPVSITLPSGQSGGTDSAEVAAHRLKFGWLILVLALAVAVAAAAGGGGDGGNRSRG